LRTKNRLSSSSPANGCQPTRIALQTGHFPDLFQELFIHTARCLRGIVCLIFTDADVDNGFSILIDLLLLVRFESRLLPPVFQTLSYWPQRQCWRNSGLIATPTVPWNAPVPAPRTSNAMMAVFCSFPFAERTNPDVVRLREKGPGVWENPSIWSRQLKIGACRVPFSAELSPLLEQRQVRWSVCTIDLKIFPRCVLLLKSLKNGLSTGQESAWHHGCLLVSRGNGTT
jgi:hypothetical protein